MALQLAMSFLKQINEYINFSKLKQKFSITPILLFLALTAYGQQQERVAIINTEDDRDSIGISDLQYLTNRLRETAVKILPKSRYGVMTTESIVAFFESQERAVKECNATSCLVDIGRKVSADYVAKAHINRFGRLLSINFDLYNVKSGNLMDSFMGNAEDIFGLLAIIDEKAPDLFKSMLDESKIPEPEKSDIPEFAKVEPWKPEVEKPSKTSFWVAIGLDLLGAAAISFGVVKNQDMKEALDRYNEMEQPPEHYKNAWKEADDNRRSRNMFYVVGGVFLISGIGVHICF